MLNYTIYHPAGNDTALVDGLVTDPARRKSINDAILSRHPNVEQVGFLADPQAAQAPQLLMAGGEFCGNATRSAAYHYLQGQAGQLQLRVRDGSRQVVAGVTADGGAYSEIPLPAGDPVRQLSRDRWLVRLDGITHLVVAIDHKPVAAKKAAIAQLTEADVDDPESVGVIFWQASTAEITPVVWVKAVDTLYCETGCASGTTAVALVARATTRQSTTILTLRQPSGEFLTATVTADSARLTGAIRRLGTARLDSHS